MYARMLRLIAITLFICSLSAQTAEARQNEKIPISVPEGQAYTVVDRLDGVEAKYREGTGNDITGPYSCAGFVTEYFLTVYGIKVSNLIDTGPPQPVGLLERVSIPQKGDLIFIPSPPSKNNHSAIVKSFDGNRITLIEQNYKWVTDGITYVTVNRTVPYPSNEYEIWRSRKAAILSDISEPETQTAALNLLSNNPATQPDTLLDDHALLELLSFQYNTDIAIEDGLHYTDSVFFDVGTLSGDKLYLFIVPDEFDLCVYTAEKEGGSVPAYRLAGPGESVTAMSAVFRRPTQPVAALQSAATDTVPLSDISPVQPQQPQVSGAVITVGSYAMQVNGERVDIDAPAFLQNNRIMLPVKWVANILPLNNQSIFWNQDTQSVTIFTQDKLIHFTVNSEILYIDGQPVRMDCPAVLQNDRAYLPVKYLADALGVTYAWDGDARAVTFY